MFKMGLTQFDGCAIVVHGRDAFETTRGCLVQNKNLALGLAMQTFYDFFTVQF